MRGWGNPPIVGGNEAKMCSFPPIRHLRNKCSHRQTFILYFSIFSKANVKYINIF